MASRRRQGFSPIHDVLHVVLAILIILMTVFAFISPTRYIMFFPMVFLLFSINCLLDSVKYFKNEEHQRYSFVKAMAMFLLFLFMFILAIIGFLNI